MGSYAAQFSMAAAAISIGYHLRMNFTCSQMSLAPALQLAAIVAQAAPANAPRTQLLLSARQRALVVTADVGGLRLQTSIAADVRQRGGLVAPTQLSSFVADLAPGDVTFKSTDRLGLEVTSNRWRSTLVCAAPSSFPAAMPLISGSRFSISEHDLVRILRQVAVAVTDFSNPALFGALLECSTGMMTMVGVDSRRVAVRRQPLEDFSGAMNVVIPHRAIEVIDVMLRRFPLERVEVTQSSTGNALQVTIGPASLICLLHAGKFAAYERLLDIPHKTTVIVSRAGLAQALRTASNFSLDAAHGVRLDFGSDGVLTASAAASDVGATDGQVQVEIDGPPARTTLGTKIAMDALAVMDTEFVELRLAGPLDPVAFRPVSVEDYLYVMNATTDTAWASSAPSTPSTSP